MRDTVESRRHVKGQSKQDSRTREVYSAGIRLMRSRVIMHPDATLTAIKIIWCLPARFNFKRWQETGLYDAGGQPDGRGISQETIATLCEVSPDSVARSMKLFERILGMRINRRRRNPVTHRFEGAESYYFPTPKEALATSATCGNGSDEAKALKYNPNGNRDEGRDAHPLPEGWVPKVPPKNEASRRELEKMKSWALANDVRRSDWDAQWHNWKIKAIEYRRQGDRYRAPRGDTRARVL